MNATTLAAVQILLKERFGFTGFRPGQREVIGQLLAGRSALAVFPTGSGKSLCYQLPALMLDGLTLVVSPLIALMKDQVDFLNRRGIAAARLDSSVSTEAFTAIQEALRARKLKLLYVAPERFANERFLARLRTLPVDLMVIDEAHCISEWGHNFRPDYLKLARLAREVGIRRVLALTATATPAVARDICREFSITPEAHIHTGFHRPNLFLRATAVPAEARTARLIARLRQQPPGAAIVYVTLQKTAEQVAAALAGADFSAEAYHAGMDSAAREAVQNRFMAAGNHRIVVATIAFGMGIDKADIRAVYHFNLPKSLENYAQEVGRAGRDGQPASCEILAAADDLTVLENFTYGDTPAPEALRALLDDVLARRSAGEVFDVSTYDLSGRHDIRPLVVSTALTYLELDGVLQSTAAFYTSYQWKFLRPVPEILARFAGERAAFLQRVFAAARVGRTWHTLDLAPADVAGTSEERERTVKALTYLEEQGDLDLRAAGVRQGYRVVRRPDDLAELGASMQRRFETRERNDLARLGAVTDLLAEPGCLVRRLLAYFGEDLGRDCGHCGACAGDPPVSLRRGAPASLVLPPELGSLRREHPRALGQPRQVARFLCGLSSPALTAAKLSRHRLFGSLAEVPFAGVIRALSAGSTSRGREGRDTVEEEPADYGAADRRSEEPARASALSSSGAVVALGRF